MDERAAKILEAFDGLENKTLTVTMRNPKSSADRTFIGPTLHDYAVKTGMLPAKMGGGGLANGYFLVEAEDGAKATIAVAEVWPNASSKDVILATEQDGEPVRAGVRLVISGDNLAGRSLAGVVSIEVKTIAPEPVEAGAGSAFHVDGLLDRPGPVDVNEFSTPTSVTTVAASGHGGQPIPPRNYSGMRLYGLLGQHGIQLNPKVHEDFLSKVVVVRGADGHAIVIAGGEIEPRFMDGDVIVATQRDGNALPSEEGASRLVVPFDLKPGRWAKGIVSIELREG
jgi:hypothetical protein